ncbi:EAL domain-containing protein [Halomonas campisalis]|uniref:EAL domain-containing protein n=1 Tax=Billgrantia campisalis TaxID=74661 RepID=A0ABS9PB59_9GAMM|nr:EAL domain-containing protein [Halomonas campisalis]
MLSGILWIHYSSAKWGDLPERYGPWKTVYDRFRQWRDDGTFEAILARLQLRLREDGQQLQGNGMPGEHRPLPTCRRFGRSLHSLLMDLVKSANLSPKRLGVEVAGSAFIGDIEAANDAIQRIRDLGIGVSVDDFGRGLSPFKCLRKLPIAVLKIDRVLSRIWRVISERES